MGKRLFINLLLFGLIVTLGLFIWLKPGQETSNKTRITSVNITDIQSIRIERLNNGTVVLEQQNNDWYITQPFHALALPGKIERILKISNISPPKTYPIDSSELKAFGLDSPTVKISFNNETLALGKTESVNARRYARNGQQLFLLDDTFIHLLTTPPHAYIDTRLFADNVQITGLQTAEFELLRHENNVWTYKKTPSIELSSDAVQMLLDEWRFARAIDVQYTPKRTAGDIVSIHFNHGKSINFKLLQEKETVTLMSIDSSLTYTFSKDKYKKMMTLPAISDNDA